MTMPLFLDSFAALLPSGMYSLQGHMPWNADQHGPEDVQRCQVLDSPYPGFGKLQIADRLAFGAVSLMLRTCCSIPDGQECGICLANAFGSLSTDQRYWESVVNGVPSPALFSATLPSSPLADIAIYFGLKGPNRVFAGSEASWIYALSEAMTILDRKKATAMVIVLLSALEPGDKQSALVPASMNKENRSYSFLVSSRKVNGGLGARISVHLNSAEKTQLVDSKETHWDKFIAMLMEKRYGCFEFLAEDACGNISIEKDE
jgi:hypothetical protein